MTYEYTIPAPGYQADNNINQTIVDRGGFVDAPSTFTPPELNATQAAPKFLERSYVAAVGTNIFLGRYMNITKRTAEMGKRYRIEDYLDNGTFISGLQNNPEPNHIALSAFGKYDYATNRSNPGLPGPLSILSTYNFTENVSPDIVLLGTSCKGSVSYTGPLTIYQMISSTAITLAMPRI